MIKEIGMYYLIARYYNPEHNVFLSASDPGDSDDPVTMNGYTYADNNPVMNIDQMGIGQWSAYICTRFETSGIISNHSGWWCSAYAAWRIGAKIRVMQAVVNHQDQTRRQREVHIQDIKLKWKSDEYATYGQGGVLRK